MADRGTWQALADALNELYADPTVALVIDYSAVRGDVFCGADGTVVQVLPRTGLWTVLRPTSDIDTN